MKTLVLYASKYGCTEDCANYLKDQLSHEAKIASLNNLKAFDLQSFDCIMIGGSIYVGKIQKEVKQFCKQNMQILLKKKLSLFMCCTTPEQSDDFFKNNFPAQLLEHAAATANFGGELRQDKMGFLDKKITALVAKAEPKKNEILYKNIDQLAATINAM